MELTYTVRGADGKEYGPVNLEQISAWTRDGRVQLHSEIQRSDMQHWARAEDFSEFQSTFTPIIPTATPISVTPPTEMADPAAASKLRSGASWFYWIAGLSLVNSIVAFTGSDWRFIVGLGITQILDVVGPEFGGAGKGIVLLLDLLVSGIFVLFGIFANKCHMWAFIVGMALFALDTLFLLLAQDWLGIAFHAFVLFCLFQGAAACRQLKA